MKDLIAKLQMDANCALGAIWMHIDAREKRIAELEAQQAFGIGETYANALSRIAELEAQIAGASAPVVEQQPVARVTQGTQFGPSLAFLANGKALPKPGTLLYAAALSVTPVAWAVTSDNTKGIHKLSMTRESADRKAAVWLEEWPNNPVRVRPLVFADATPPTADTSSLRDAILKLPLPNGQTEDGAFRDLSSWEREVFVRGALSMRKAAADTVASTALQAPVREVPGWQPIEAAPKDGREVLLWLPAPYSRIAKARWFDLWENWQEGEFPSDQDEYCGIGSRLPTHYMPLPAAPVQQEGE